MDTIPDSVKQEAQRDVNYILYKLKEKGYITECTSLTYEISDGDGTTTLDVAVHASFFIDKLNDTIPVTWEYFVERIL